MIYKEKKNGLFTFLLKKLLFFVGSNGRLQFLRPQSAQKAAALLGCTVEDLAKSIFSSDHSGPVSGKVSPR